MALTAKEIAQIRADLAKILAAQQKTTENSGDYLKIIKQIKEVQKDTNLLKKEQLKQTANLAKANADLVAANLSGNAAAIASATKSVEIHTEILKILGQELAIQQKITDNLVEQAKKASKVKAIIKTSLTDLATVYKGLKKAYNFLDSSDIMKMSKSIKTSALNMGVLSQQADAFSRDIQVAAQQTIDIGVGIEDIAKIQSTYSEELGRTVMLGVKGATALGEMGIATGLGAEGAAQFAASMDSVGLSAEKTGEYINQVMNDAHNLGLNSSKIIKNIQGNIKLLNRYNFKKGIQGLAAMAESTTKMGVNMELIAPMADKLFDIEGAVEMSAQLQVLGGEWAKLADPFKLMYMARNDMAGLTDTVIKATTATAQFNKETKVFDISSLEMQRLRKVAEATGLDFEQLAQSAKKAAQYSAIKKQIAFDIDPKTEQFIESTAMFDENGKAQIEVNGSTKYLNALTQADKAALTSEAAQQESMKQRAKDALNFNDKINNLFTMVKQFMVPLVDALNKKLGPKLDELAMKFKNPKFIDGIISFATGAANIVAKIGEFIIKWPKLTASLFILFEASKWFANGLILGKGFNAVASAGGAGGTGGGGGKWGKMGRGGKMGVGAGGGLLIGGVNALFADSVGEGIGNVLGGVVGGVLGSFFGPWGAMIGSQLGSSAGGWIGGPSENKNSNSPDNKTVNDGVVNFNPRDKFMKVNDSTMIAGTNVNGNKELAKILSGGIPTLPNKDALMSSTQNGVINSTTNPIVPSSMSINFGELKFTGSIELTNGQGVSTDLSKQLLNSPSFIRDMSKLVHVETAKAVSGINQQKVK